MQYKFLLIYSEFCTKKISYLDFIKEMDNYLNHINPAELKYFYDYTTDYSFPEYDPDMVMLTYIYLWLMPNRINKTFELVGADNMYLNFLKACLVEMNYKYEDIVTISYNLNYLIYKLNDNYLIININDFDIDIMLPKELCNKKLICLNCNEEIDNATKLPLYPYGFYLLKTNSPS